MTRPQSFNVSGTVRTYPDDALPKARVRFDREKFTETVFTDEKGFYDVNLPVGLYTMTVNAMKPGLKEYRRPLFRIESPTHITFDVILMAGVSCDFVVPNGSDQTPTREEAQDACGGLDAFQLPSEDGAPFQLFIDYPGRQRTDRETVYTRRDLQGFRIPVLVAYNLFTLRADRVVYDEKSRKLEADGNVVATSGNDETRRADTMMFRIENGHAVLLHQAHDGKVSGV